MGWTRETYVAHRSRGFNGLFPGHMALVEASTLAGMLIKYEEDFILCSKIEEAMAQFPKDRVLFPLDQTLIKARPHMKNEESADTQKQCRVII